LDFVLFQVIFPTLCLSPDEVTLFTEDPVEFVRKVHDPTEVRNAPYIHNQPL
jgi:hypothetical protein